MKFNFVILASFAAVALSHPIEKRADATTAAPATTTAAATSGGDVLSPLLGGLTGVVGSVVGTAESATGGLLKGVGEVAGDAETDVLDPVVSGVSGATSGIL